MAAGILRFTRQGEQPGWVVPQEATFSTLQELLELCASQSEGAGFVQVEVAGEIGGRQHRLVLDFGHFGPDSE